MSSIRARNRGSFNDIQQFYFERATHMVATCVCTMTVALHMHEIEHYRQEIKNMNKVSVKEAAEAKRQLEMMQEIMKQQQNRKMSLT